MKKWRLGIFQSSRGKLMLVSIHRDIGLNHYSDDLKKEKKKKQEFYINHFFEKNTVH